MLRPHDREDAELDEVGLATERLQDAPIFLVAEPVLGDHFGGDAGGVEYVHARVISGGAGWGLGWNESSSPSPSLRDREERSDVVSQELFGGEDEDLRPPVD